jgi:hypothetical protein
VRAARPDVRTLCVLWGGDGTAPGGAPNAKEWIGMTDSTTNTGMTRPEVFAELASRGADRAVVEFSGGNDEGGPDSITLYKGESGVGGLSASAYAGADSTAEERADAELVASLSQPIYDAYGGFDGDFDVNGEVIWDAEEKTVQMIRDERSDYEHSEDYL